MLIDEFEGHLYGGRLQEAGQALFVVMRRLEETNGAAMDCSADRMAAALGAFFMQPAVMLDETAFLELMVYQRWLGVIFGASSYGNADHVRTQDVRKAALLHTLDSARDVDYDELWAVDRATCAYLVGSLLTQRLVLSKEAERRRKYLYWWLPKKLAECTLEDIPSRLIHDIYFNSSYVPMDGGHAVKAALNEICRQTLLGNGLADTVRTKKNARPVLAVVVESMSDTHVGFRSFSKMLAGLKARFRTVGVMLQQPPNDKMKALFDATVTLQPPAGDIVAWVCGAQANVARFNPDVVLFLSVGMHPSAVYLSNLRMAPVQIVTHGHPASTFSPCIDYFLAEEGYDDFPMSEKRLRCPDASFLTVRPPPGPQVRRIEQKDGIDIGVVCTPMKLNHDFMRVLQRIGRGTGGKHLFWHFMVGASFGLNHMYAERRIKEYFPDAFVYPQMERDKYMETIAHCDLCLHPFPFGNSNSLLDCYQMGVPGVSLHGRELFAQMPRRMTSRCALAATMVRDTVDEYVTEALRLIGDDADREAQRQIILEAMSREHIALFEDDDHGALGNIVASLLEDAPEAKVTHLRLPTGSHAELMLG